eukprot:3559250-Alexandrium_andersonii.AAC.1
MLHFFAVSFLKGPCFTAEFVRCEAVEEAADAVACVRLCTVVREGRRIPHILTETDVATALHTQFPGAGVDDLGFELLKHEWQAWDSLLVTNREMVDLAHTRAVLKDERKSFAGLKLLQEAMRPPRATHAKPKAPATRAKAKPSKL